MGTTYGLMLYRNVKGRFWKHIQNHSPEIYQYDSNNPKSLISNRLTALYEDKNGTIWLGTHSALVKVHVKLKSLEFEPFGEDRKAWQII